MWAVGCIYGLIFLVNISAGVHLDGKNDHDQFQLENETQDLSGQEIELESDLEYHHHVQQAKMVSNVILTKH